MVQGLNSHVKISRFIYIQLVAPKYLCKMIISDGYGIKTFAHTLTLSQEKLHQ